MTLPVTGPLAMSMVNSNLNVPASSVINMGGSNVRYFAGDGSGAISMSQLLGKTNLIGPWSGRISEVTSTGVQMNDITWNGSVWIAVSANGPIMTSSDLATWTARTGNVSQWGVAANGSTIVTCGGGSVFYRSTDGGVNWTSFTVGSGIGFNKVAFGNGLFVAGGSAGTVYTSPDGVTWTARTSNIPSNANVLGIVRGSSVWVIVGETGAVSTSSDGITWTARNSTTANALIEVCWTGTQFAAVGTVGTILTSPDGITWTYQTSGTGVQLNTIAWTGSYFLAMGVNGIYLTSSNSTTWTVSTSNGMGNTIWSVVYANSTIVCVGNNSLIASTTTGSLTNWAARQGPSNTAGEFNDVAVNPSGNFVMVGAGSNRVQYSSDGLSWSGTLVTQSAGQYFCVAWNGSYFCALGPSQRSITSSDGITWTVNTTATPSSTPRAVTWGNSLWVAVFDNGDIWSSPDAVTWTQRATTFVGLTAVTWSGSRFVAVGSSGYVQYSDNGTSWTNIGQIAGGTVNLGAVTWMGTQFVAGTTGGTTARLYTSANGTSWALSYTSASNFSFTGLLWQDNVLYLVGSGGFIYTSFDAITLVQRTSNTIRGFTGVAGKSNRLVASTSGGTAGYAFATPSS